MSEHHAFFVGDCVTDSGRKRKKHPPLLLLGDLSSGPRRLTNCQTAGRWTSCGPLNQTESVDSQDNGTDSGLVMDTQDGLH